MQTLKQTPAPWEYIKEKAAIRRVETKAIVAFCADDADANFIVHACNAHEALLAALEAMISAQTEQDPFNDKGGIDFEGRYIGHDERGRILMDRALTKAREAISKAKGE